MAKVYSFQGVTPVIHPDAFVHPDAVLIGDVIVGPGCYVAPGAALRGDFGRLILEEGCNFQDNCVMHGFPDRDTVIERDGHIGHGAVIHGAHIGRNALVGMNAVVMDYATVGDEAFVAAMSFVKANDVIQPRTLYAGIPAKAIRELSEEEIAWKSRGTNDYKELARSCLDSLVEAEPLSEVERDRARMQGNFTPPLFKLRSDAETGDDRAS